MTGYESKRAAAQDKLAQPAQKPVAFSKQNYLNGYCVGQADLLAEQAKQGPVAWMVYTMDGQSVYVTDNPIDLQEGQRALPLYTTSLQRTWVDLTDEEIEAIYLQHHNQYDECESPNWGYERAIQNKLKERNA